MKDIKLDLNTHDIEITGRGMSLVEDLEALRQRIKIKLLFFYGEWFLDTSLGLNWFKLAFIKNPNQNFIDNMIMITITDDSEITNLLEYSASISSSRELSVKFKASTIYNVPILFNERFTI